MRIITGVDKLSPGLQIILEQEGIPYRQVDWQEGFTPKDLSCLVVFSPLTAVGREAVISYLTAGGAVLFSPEGYGSFCQKRLSRRKKKYLIASDDSPFSSTGLIDIYGQYSGISGSELASLDPGLGIKFREWGQGYLVVLPFNPDLAILDLRSARKKFPAARQELPSEIVSLVSKGKMRRILRIALEYLFTRRQLPFLQKSYYPEPWNSCFLFRIDTDFASASDISTLYSLCREFGIRATWFIDVQKPELLTSLYGQMADQEIALHCGRHLIFKGYDANYRNLAEARNIMLINGFQVQGFASPYGDWHPDLGDVLANLDFSYSSEFTLDYDDLPFFPYYHGQFAEVLQIPVHPISPGRLRRSHFSPAEMQIYFDAYIARCLALEEPVVLYHHPGHRLWPVITKLFARIRELQLPVVDFRQWHDWWRERLALKLESTYKEGKLILNPVSGKKPYIRLVRDGRSACSGWDEVIDPDQLTWQITAGGPGLSETGLIRRRHWRDWLYNYESWRGKRKQ